MPFVAIYAGGSIWRNYEGLLGANLNYVNLNSLHIGADGSLALNETPLIDAAGNPTQWATKLAGIIKQLKGSGVQLVLLSIGGGVARPPDPNGINSEHSASDDDGRNFCALYFGQGGMTGNLTNDVPILGRLRTLLGVTGADGFDLDFEPNFYTYEGLASAILTLSEWLGMTSGNIFTWMPLTSQSSFAGMASMLHGAGGGVISWAHLQPSAWHTPADVASWGTALQIGSPNVMIGFNGDAPKTMQASIATVVTSGTQIYGAYFWNYDFIMHQPVANYVAAMQRGLSGIMP